MHVVLTLLALAAKTTTPDCVEADWPPLGLASPCSDRDPTNPPAKAMARAWNLSPKVSQAAARAWALGNSEQAAEAWLAVAKTVPARFEPIAAIALRCWRAPAGSLIAAIEGSAVPIENARRLLAGFRDRHVRGSHTPAIYRWLLDRGPPGMQTIADVELEKTAFGVAVGLGGLARLEAAGAGAPPDLRVAWARETLRVALALSLAHLATEIHGALDAATQERLAIAAGGGSSDIRRALAVAFLLEGARDPARRLARTAVTAEPGNLDGARSGASCTDFQALALRDGGTPLSPSDLFDARVSLRRCHYPAPQLAVSYPRFPEDRRLLAEKFSSQEKWFAAQTDETRNAARGTDLEDAWKRVQAELAFERERYRRLATEADDGRREGGRPETAAAAAKIVAPAGSLNATFDEDPAGSPKIETPPCPDLPNEYHLVTARKTPNGSCIVVAESQALDPTGEASGGGYWLFLWKDDAWDAGGIYLGLRKYRPYQITPGGEVSLQDGTLRIAVRRRQLDESSVGFPPVGTRFEREGPPLMLRANLAVLARDTDGDGIRDLEEERMLLDPRRADTDGDGIKDGNDAFPNVPNRGPAPGTASLLTAFFAATEGQEETALITEPGAASPAVPAIRTIGQHRVLFVEGDPSSFVGVRGPPSRVVVVLRSAEVRRAVARFGAFYPQSIDAIMHPAGTKAFIWWRVRWAGGSYEATRTGDVWTLKQLAGWIT